MAMVVLLLLPLPLPLYIVSYVLSIVDSFLLPSFMKYGKMAAVSTLILMMIAAFDRAVTLQLRFSFVLQFLLV